MKSKQTWKLVTLATLLGMAASAPIIYAHCQIPCGIYDDPARFDMIAEHIATIDKSMKQINKHSQANPPDMNQTVRWVENKEKHADKLSRVVTYYFMAQRIKPVAPAEKEAYAAYVTKLTLLHEMLFYSMKAKQTTDLSHVKKLGALLAQFRTAYFAQGN